MRIRASGPATRLAWSALVVLPAWACAVAVDTSPVGDDPAGGSSASGGDFVASGGSAVSSSGSVGSGNTTSKGGGTSAGSGGQVNAFGGSSGVAGHPSGGSTGASGAASGGATGAAGMTGMAGKGGSASGGTSSGGTSSGGTSSGGAAGKGGSASGGTGSAGTSSGGSGGSVSSGGSTGGGTCDAAHAVATLAHSATYSGTANACVRLSVNPTWSSVALQFQAQPGTIGYPVPFSYTSCKGNGSGSLPANYTPVMLLSGNNPGCDVYVQFTGGATALKVIYYD